MMRRGLILATGLALAACETAGVTAPVAMFAGDMVVTPPSGYCTDPLSSRLRTGFAVFAPCITLGTEAPLPAIFGVATVQAGDVGSAMVKGAEPGLRDFLTGPQGAGILSSAGSSTNVQVVSAQSFDGHVIVHFTDSGAPPLDGLGQDEWRAFTDVNGRLVTVSVRASDDAPITAARGAALLDLVLANIKIAGSTLAPRT